MIRMVVLSREPFHLTKLETNIDLEALMTQTAASVTPSVFADEAALDVLELEEVEDEMTGA